MVLPYVGSTTPRPVRHRWTTRRKFYLHLTTVCLGHMYAGAQARAAQAQPWVSEALSLTQWLPGIKDTSLSTFKRQWAVLFKGAPPENYTEKYL